MSEKIITCCHVAIVLAFTNLLSLAIFAGYTINLKNRTLKLEQKNGHELGRIEKLEQKNGKELKEIKKLKGEIRLLKALMTLSEEARQMATKKMEKADNQEEWDDEPETK